MDGSIFPSEWHDRIPVDYKIKTHLGLSGVYLTIYDAHGKLVFRVEDRSTPRRVKILFDAAGAPLITATHQKDGWQGFSGNGQESKDLIFTVQKKPNSTFENESEVFLPRESLEDPKSSFTMRGSPFRRSCTIYRGDSVRQLRPSCSPHNTHANMPYYSSQVSSDLIWEVARNQNAYLVKRSSGGGIRLSRDPLNLLNIHSRKHAGFVNDKAVGVIPAAGEKGGVTLITKKEKNTQQPGAGVSKTSFGGSKSTRKTYKGIASHVAKSGYRSDLRSQAVSRASAIRQSQRPVKEAPESKLRGSKAKKAAAAKEE